MGIELERDRWTVLREAKETENTWKVEVHAVQGSIREHFKRRGKQASQGRRGHWETYHSIRIFSSEHLSAFNLCLYLHACLPGDTRQRGVLGEAKGLDNHLPPQAFLCPQRGPGRHAFLEAAKPWPSGLWSRTGSESQGEHSSTVQPGKCPSNSVAMC